MLYFNKSSVVPGTFKVLFYVLQYFRTAKTLYGITTYQPMYTFFKFPSTSFVLSFSNCFSFLVHKTHFHTKWKRTKKTLPPKIIQHFNLTKVSRNILAVFAFCFFPLFYTMTFILPINVSNIEWLLNYWNKMAWMFTISFGKTTSNKHIFLQ